VELKIGMPVRVKNLNEYGDIVNIKPDAQGINIYAVRMDNHSIAPNHDGTFYAREEELEEIP
jgi:hypothetical protein